MASARTDDQSGAVELSTSHRTSFTLVWKMMGYTCYALCINIASILANRADTYGGGRAFLGRFPVESPSR